MKIEIPSKSLLLSIPKGIIFVADLTVSLSHPVPARLSGQRQTTNRAAAWKKKGLHNKAKGQMALLLLERASAAVGKKPLQYVHSHANTSTGKNHDCLTALTDRFVLCTVGCHHPD